MPPVPAGSVMSAGEFWIRSLMSDCAVGNVGFTLATVVNLKVVERPSPAVALLSLSRTRAAKVGLSPTLECAVPVSCRVPALNESAAGRPSTL